MIAIVCLDDRGGMLFHKRRQSRDRKVVEKILEMCRDHTLWIHPFSETFFQKEMSSDIKTDENFLEKAGAGEFCFVENQKLEEWEEKLEGLVIFWWNRCYPGDFTMHLKFEDWEKTEEEEFQGYSHEKITKEVYRK